MPIELTAQVMGNMDGLGKQLKAIQYLNKHAVFVGIPDGSGGREGGVTNSQLGYIHTNGTKRGIPARPFLEPALAAKADQVGALLQRAAEAAATGDVDTVHGALEMVGVQAENIVKAWFTDSANAWPPNSTATIMRKSRIKANPRAKDKAKARAKAKAKGAMSRSTPLVDTGQLRKSITHVIREI